MDLRIVSSTISFSAASLPHHCLIHQQRYGLHCTFAVAVGHSCTHSNSLLRLGIHHIPPSAAAGPHVPRIEQILEEYPFVAVFVLGVHILVSGDIAHIVGGEDPLDIEAA